MLKVTITMTVEGKFDAGAIGTADCSIDSPLDRPDFDELVSKMSTSLAHSLRPRMLNIEAEHRKLAEQKK